MGCIPFPFVFMTKYMLNMPHTAWGAATLFSVVSSGLYYYYVEKRLQREHSYFFEIQRAFTYERYRNISLATPVIAFAIFPFWNVCGRIFDAAKISFHVIFRHEAPDQIADKLHEFRSPKLRWMEVHDAAERSTILRNLFSRSQWWRIVKSSGASGVMHMGYMGPPVIAGAWLSAMASYEAVKKCLLVLDR